MFSLLQLSLRYMLFTMFLFVWVRLFSRIGSEEIHDYWMHDYCGLGGSAWTRFLKLSFVHTHTDSSWSPVFSFKLCIDHEFASLFTVGFELVWLHVLCLCSDIYPSLERVCLEGTRAQSKLAVSAIAALTDTSDQFIFSELCEV